MPRKYARTFQFDFTPARQVRIYWSECTLESGFHPLRFYIVPTPSFDPPKIKVFPQAAPILDFIWYPRATPSDGSSFCFVASVRESPVRLLDASDGRVSSFPEFFFPLCHRAQQ
jgi:hypothetical protein